MDVLSLCPLPAAPLVWELLPGRWVLTVVCKATFRLEPGVLSLADEQEPIRERDRHWDDDPARSLFAPTDLVPFKLRADVLLVGSAHAKNGQPVRSLVARLAVGNADKSIEVVSPRVRTRDGEVREGKRWTRQPVSYERAAGGPGTDNPVGLGPGTPRDPYGQLPLPSLLPVGFPQDTERAPAPMAFGPIASGWPLRRGKLGRGAPDHDFTAAPFGDGFDAAYFQAAPPDQQIDTIRPTERITLENLHPRHALLVTSLPGLAPRARVELGGPPREIGLVGDTLWIDADAGICTVTFRAKVDLERADQDGRVLVALAKGDQTIPWAKLAPAPSAPSMPVAQPVISVPSAPAAASPVIVPPARKSMPPGSPPVTAPSLGSMGGPTPPAPVSPSAPPPAVSVPSARPSSGLPGIVVPPLPASVAPPPGPPPPTRVPPPPSVVPSPLRSNTPVPRRGSYVPPPPRAPALEDDAPALRTSAPAPRRGSYAPPSPLAPTPAPPAAVHTPAPPTTVHAPAPPAAAHTPVPPAFAPTPLSPAFGSAGLHEPIEEELSDVDVEITLSEPSTRTLDQTGPVRPITRPVAQAMEGSALPFHAPPPGWQSPAARPSRPSAPPPLASPVPPGPPPDGLSAFSRTGRRNTLPDWFDTGAMPPPPEARPPADPPPVPSPVAPAPPVAPPPLLTSASPWTSPPAPPPLVSAPPGDSFGALEASNAAVRPFDTPPRSEAEPDARPPETRSSPAPIESVVVEIVWFEPLEGALLAHLPRPPQRDPSPVSALAADRGPAEPRSPNGNGKPGDARSGDAKSGDAKSGDAKSGDARSANAKPGDARTADAGPGDGRTGEPPPSAEALLAERMRGRFHEVLTRGTPIGLGALEAALEAVEEDSPPRPAVALVTGTLELCLDEIEMLKALVATASPLASSDKKLKEVVDVAAQMLEAPMIGMPDFAQGLGARIRDAWTKANRVLPPDHLAACTERQLLEQRSYQKRDLLDDTWIRALLSNGGVEVPVYLPVRIAKRLPLFRRFQARVIGEVVWQQDQYETSPVALRAVALGRLPVRTRGRGHENRNRNRNPP